MNHVSSNHTVHALPAGLAALALLAASQVARADMIPYPTPGVVNPVTYSFTAVATGEIVAYFAGSGASFDEQLGMLVNGVMSPAGFGLDDHTSAIGDSFNLGHVTAGDSLTFVVKVISPDLGLVFSDPSLNTAYDLNGSVGHNHIYSTPYTATSPVFAGVPVGTYVGFEDLQFPASDFNYFDETYVFTNVAVEHGTVPESGTTVILLGLGLVGLALVWRFARRRSA